MRWRYLNIAFAAVLALCAGQAQAGDMAAGRLDLYPSLSGDSAIELAANDSGSMSDAAATPHSNFEESAFTANKLHGYLGVASLAAALVAGMTAPDNEGVVVTPGAPIKKGAHHYAGLTAAALGGAAVVSGLLLHADDLTPDILDPDTAHFILGILGTAAYTYAVSKGPTKYGMGKGSHAAAGMAGAAVMATAIYLEF